MAKEKKKKQKKEKKVRVKKQRTFMDIVKLFIFILLVVFVIGFFIFRWGGILTSKFPPIFSLLFKLCVR